MHIPAPRLPQTLTPAEDFATYVRPLMKDDAVITRIKTQKEQCERADFYRMDLRESVLETCGFHKCCFEKASFIDVEFRGCDFSNSNFQGAYFERCRFIACKCIGADMVGAMVKHTVFEECNLQYANLNTAKLTGVLWKTVDFTDASMAEAKLAKFYTEASKFIRNDFSKTMLAGIDFSGNVLIAPTLSSPPIELKGILIDMLQAPDLVGLLGVKVKEL